MNRHILIAILAIIALAFTGSASAQLLVDTTEAGLEADWVEDSDFHSYSGSGPLVTNEAWEWWGGTAWQLYGWNTDGTRNSSYYLRGQYGWNKRSRDFTDTWLNYTYADGDHRDNHATYADWLADTATWHPDLNDESFDTTAVDNENPFDKRVFGGTVAAFPKNQWTVTPGPVYRVEKQITDTTTGTTTTATGDHCLQAQGWNTKNNHYIGDAAAEGQRVRVNFDYVFQDEDNDTFELSLVGLNDNNQNRKPYFGWDHANDSTDLANLVQPGPDYIKWDGGSTGQSISLLDGSSIFAPEATASGAGLVWDWQTSGFSFVVPAAEAGRGGAFDNIAVLWEVEGSASLVRAIDNLEMYAVKDGDANEDGAVDLTDLIALGQNYGESGDWAAGDFNNDGTVDLSDLIPLGQNYGTDYFASSTPGITVTPEPATMSLLGLGGLALLRRRRNK
jgi:hypothetical protein